MWPKMVTIDFDVQEESKNTVGNSGGKISEGGLPRNEISQKWPNFFHKTKIYMDHI